MNRLRMFGGLDCCAPIQVKLGAGADHTIPQTYTYIL